MTATRHPYLDAPPLAVAHRGGAGYPPHAGLENTMAAFRGAVQLGYRYLETDVHRTADGVLIAFHDDVLDRVTDGHGRVRDLAWAQVERARVGGGEPIPTLGELLDALPETRINIDLKAAGTPASTLAVVRAHNAAQRVCIGSFSPARLWRFRWLARGQGIATSAGPLGVAALRFLPRGLSRLVHSPGIAYQVPVTQTLLGREIEVVTPGFVAAAHAIGRQVHVWTIDDPEEMQRLLDLGVDGIVTDRIDVLRDVLAQRAQAPR